MTTSTTTNRLRCTFAKKKKKKKKNIKVGSNATDSHAPHAATDRRSIGARTRRAKSSDRCAGRAPALPTARRQASCFASDTRSDITTSNARTARCWVSARFCYLRRAFACLDTTPTLPTSQRSNTVYEKTAATFTRASERRSQSARPASGCADG